MHLFVRPDHLERSQNGSVAAMVAPEETLNRFAGPLCLSGRGFSVVASPSFAGTKSLDTYQANSTAC